MKAGSRIAVIGSREFRYLVMVSDFVRTMPTDLILVSGGARGVDRMAELTAREINMSFKIYLPDWKQDGKKAGILRNKLILENCDAVIAFWDGNSKGAGYTIRRAKELKIPIKIFNGSEPAVWSEDIFVS